MTVTTPGVTPVSGGLPGLPVEVTSHCLWRDSREAPPNSDHKVMDSLWPGGADNHVKYINVLETVQFTYGPETTQTSLLITCSVFFSCGWTESLVQSGLHLMTSSCWSAYVRGGSLSLVIAELISRGVICHLPSGHS